MTAWIEKSNEKFGKYPQNIKEMIGNNPIRQHWTADAWSRPYLSMEEKDIFYYQRF